MNLGLCKQIQLVVSVRLEHGALQLLVECSYRLATLPPYKRSEWVYEAFHPMDQRWKSYAITDDKSEKRRLFLWYPSWLRKWDRGQGTHVLFIYTPVQPANTAISSCSLPLRRFCSADLPPEMSFVARSQGRQLLSQATDCLLWRFCSSFTLSVKMYQLFCLFHLVGAGATTLRQPAAENRKQLFITCYIGNETKVVFTMVYYSFLCWAAVELFLLTDLVKWTALLPELTNLPQYQEDKMEFCLRKHFARLFYCHVQ